MEAGLRIELETPTIYGGLDDTIYVDLTKPGVFKVEAINALTRLRKTYMLRVTEKSLTLV